MTYRTHARCINCHIKQSLAIPRGETIGIYLHRKQWIDKTLTCGRCGCRTLVEHRCD